MDLIWIDKEEKEKDPFALRRAEDKALQAQISAFMSGKSQSDAYNRSMESSGYEESYVKLTFSIPHYGEPTIKSEEADSSYKYKINSEAMMLTFGKSEEYDQVYDSLMESAGYKKNWKKKQFPWL